METERMRLDLVISKEDDGDFLEILKNSVDYFIECDGYKVDKSKPMKYTIKEKDEEIHIEYFFYPLAV